jgi:hypothetical protein
MRKRRFIVGIFVGLLLTGAVSRTVSMAQEDEYNLAYADVFGKLRRPLVRFSHAIHSDNLADAGCGICHHNPDNKTGKLVYIEGEELSCKECHEAQKENHKPALREAFHGSCTVCHRDMIQTNKHKTGPTTCGSCHKKF